MTKMLSSLDWEGELDDAEFLSPASIDSITDRLREGLGDGAIRWILGTSESFVAQFGIEVQDPLASRKKFVLFSQQLLASILLGLLEGEPPSIKGIHRDREIIADFVTRGTDMRAIGDSLRKMQREILVRLVERLADIGPDSSILAEIAAGVTGTMDLWLEWMLEATFAERDRAARAEEVRVRGAIEDLLAGGPVNLTATSELLSRPIDAWHVCCAIGASPEVSLEQDSIDVVATGFASAHGDPNPLRYVTAGGETYVWATISHEPGDLPALDVEVPERMSVGIGSAGRGAEGFRISRREAADAFQLSLRIPATEPVKYQDASLAILLCQDEERARVFVQDELGEIARDTPEAAEMRDTMRTFFAMRMRIAPSAEKLFLHRNSLINRLDRIERTLGHSLAERTPELQAALTIADLYPTVGE